MHLDPIPGDRRPEQINRIRQELDRLIAGLDDVPPRLIAAAMADFAKRLALRLEDDPLFRPGRRGRAS